MDNNEKNKKKSQHNPAVAGDLGFLDMLEKASDEKNDVDFSEEQIQNVLFGKKESSTEVESANERKKTIQKVVFPKTDGINSEFEAWINDVRNRPSINLANRINIHLEGNVGQIFNLMRAATGIPANLLINSVLVDWLKINRDSINAIISLNNNYLSMIYKE
jgi:hypothetical protein